MHKTFLIPDPEGEKDPFQTSFNLFGRDPVSPGQKIEIIFIQAIIQVIFVQGDKPVFNFQTLSIEKSSIEEIDNMDFCFRFRV